MLRTLLFVALALLGFDAPAHAEHRGGEVDHRSGMRPADDGTCALSHPIKGTFTRKPRQRRCVYHRPRQAEYETIAPDRCYATEGEAKHDRCRPAKR